MGGNRGTFNDGQPEVFGTPDSFEKAFSDAPAFRGVEQEGAPEFNANPNLMNAKEAPNIGMENQDALGMKPLAMDGSTEGKLGKLALRLSGEELDEASAKEVRGKISELKDKPYELQNYRDEVMVEFLRDSFGRIFGDDSTASGGKN